MKSNELYKQLMNSDYHLDLVPDEADTNADSTFSDDPEMVSYFIKQDILDSYPFLVGELLASQ